MIARIVSTTAALLVLVCSACAVAPEEEQAPEGAPPAVENDGVDPTLFNTSGGTGAKTTCSKQCDNWCTVKNGRKICGWSCICVIVNNCTCPTVLEP